MKKEIKIYKTKYEYCKYQIDKLLNFLSKFENISKNDNIFKSYEFYNKVNKNILIIVPINNNKNYNITIQYHSTYFQLYLDEKKIIFKVQSGSLIIPIINIFFNDKNRVPMGNYLNLEFYINNIITALSFDRKLLGIEQDNEETI